MNVRLVPVGGSNQIEVDGKIIDSLAFKTFRPEATNIDDFYFAGVRLFNVITSGRDTAFGVPYSLFGESWLGDGVYDFSVVDRQLDFFIEHAPDALYILNFHLDTRSWWLESHPDASDSYTCLSQVAADPDWRRTTAHYIHAMISHVEEQYHDKVCGYVLLGGHTTEWFSDCDYQASHPTKLDAYRKYLSNPTAEIPSIRRLEQDQEKLFLDPKSDLDIITYERFHSKLIADTVLHFCHEAQRILQHRKLLGVFFGYLLELYSERLWNAGHLDIDRVYDSPDIDLIATPSSYQFRKHEDAGAYMLLAHTLPIHNKAYFASFDHRTYRYRPVEEGCRISDLGGILQNEREVTDVMRREMMQRWANSAGHWWFGMFATWLHDDAVMREVKHLVEVSSSMYHRPAHSISEIAVFLSCDSMYYVNKECDINTYTILNARDALSRIGAPVDYLSIRDMRIVDLTQYKLCIFPNAYALQEDERSVIREKLMAGNHTLLWITAPDYITNTGFSQKNMERLLGMNVEKLVTPETSYFFEKTPCGCYGHAVSPTFKVEDPRAESLGYYEISGAVALASRRMDNYISVFSGLGNLSHTALRAIASKAGVHLYADDGIPVYVNSLLTGFYWHENITLKIRLREPGVYRDILSNRIYHTDDGRLDLNTTDSGAICLEKANECELQNRDNKQ